MVVVVVAVVVVVVSVVVLLLVRISYCHSYYHYYLTEKSHDVQVLGDVLAELQAADLLQHELGVRFRFFCFMCYVVMYVIISTLS